MRATGPAEGGPGEGGIGAGGAGPGARAHLISTAAGPLGGDVVEVDVTVAPGAHLELRGVAATLALPSRAGGSSRVLLRLRVGAGARCDAALQPVVVAAGADTSMTTEVDVAAGGHLDLTELVVLGRWGEAPGRWRGSLHADLGGRAWLRQSIALGPGAPAWDALAAPRALVSRLRTGGAPGGARTAGDAVLLPLARGGTLLEAYGIDLAAAQAWAAQVGAVAAGAPALAR